MVQGRAGARGRCGLAKKPGHPSVGQNLPRGLARGAVGHFAGVERHASHRVPTTRAGLAMTIVDREAVAHLGRQSHRRVSVLDRWPRATPTLWSRRGDAFRSRSTSPALQKDGVGRREGCRLRIHGRSQRRLSDRGGRCEAVACPHRRVAPLRTQVCLARDPGRRAGLRRPARRSSRRPCVRSRTP